MQRMLTLSQIGCLAVKFFIFIFSIFSTLFLLFPLNRLNKSIQSCFFIRIILCIQQSYNNNLTSDYVISLPAWAYVLRMCVYDFSSNSQQQLLAPIFLYSCCCCFFHSLLFVLLFCRIAMYSTVVIHSIFNILMLICSKFCSSFRCAKPIPNYQTNYSIPLSFSLPLSAFSVLYVGVVFHTILFLLIFFFARR